MTRYLEIAETLAAELADSAPGTKVASEPELAHRFGVGRASARAALQELEHRLLVRRVQGAGTFVNSRIDYVISRSRLPSWHATVAAAGATPRSVVRAADRVAMPAPIAERLERRPGDPVHRVVREFYINELLAGFNEEWVPVDVVADLDLALHAVDSIDLVLRQMGKVLPVRAWCRVSLDVPPPVVTRELRIEASTMVYLIESLSRDADSGRALMCNNGWTRADAVRMVVEMTDQ
ncbi:GntR family transcriptional regulator [Actinoplanes sp. TBRC 11911]|uniref:GntR family transcriptional regulator n=1 Tax=Actinoplanes sp. TBRC 11911 TaxID=2729386 RepID=UPI00145E495B|nr:GntR family transcriptional regulator [Actinoplanes sp. TBRC 11911]NMO49985.1 GntR family transcriptional regulator [Actinoplanes sp. TBRC 11911]